MSEAATLANGHHKSNVSSQTTSADESSADNVQQVEAEDDEDTGVYEVESLCMNCHENGVTKLLLLKIPYFREVILESFECEHCHYKNSTVKSGDQIQEKGSKFTFKLQSVADFERQLIISDSGAFHIDDLGIEMPKNRGQITNIEGVLSSCLRDLESLQRSQEGSSPEVAEKLRVVSDALARMINGVAFPFKISLDDPTGNSWIARDPDDTSHKYYQQDYFRTAEQNEELGLGLEDSEPNQEDSSTTEQDPLTDVDILSGQVYSIPASCPACTRSCIVNTQMLNIPHFKEVIVMATVCGHCGYKSNEVKTGGAIPEKGQRITLTAKKVVDLSRDLLKSQTCAIECPQLELHVDPGTMGGRFTTVEGLLGQVKEDLRGKIFGIGDEDLTPGDSMSREERGKWNDFFGRLDKALKAEMEFTLILEDPLASSYVQSLGDENGKGDFDPQVKVEEYERTEEEEEELGLKDMKTDGYEADEADKANEAAEASETTAKVAS